MPILQFRVTRRRFCNLREEPHRQEAKKLIRESTPLGGKSENEAVYFFRPCL